MHHHLYVKVGNPTCMFVAFCPFQTAVLLWFQFQCGACIEERIIYCYINIQTRKCLTAQDQHPSENCVLGLLISVSGLSVERVVKISNFEFKFWLFKFWFKEAARSNVSQENYRHYRKSKEGIWLVTHPIYLGAPCRRNALKWSCETCCTDYCKLLQHLAGADSDSGLTFSWHSIFDSIQPKPRKPHWVFVAHALLLFTVTSAWMFQKHFLTVIKQKQPWCYSAYCKMLLHSFSLQGTSYH